MRLRRLEITAVSGSLVLMELALDQTVVTRDTQVRIEADGPWIAVHGGGFRPGLRFQVRIRCCHAAN